MGSKDDVARYDSEDFSPALKGWLNLLRGLPKEKGKHQDALALIREDMPSDLKAWLWTLGHRNPFVEFMIPFMPDVMSANVAAVDDEYYTGGDQTALEMLGVENAVQLTMCGGGHSALIATWAPGDESMTLHRLDNSEGSNEEIGSFQNLFDEAVSKLEDKDEDERAELYEDFEKWAKLVKKSQGGARKRKSTVGVQKSAVERPPKPEMPWDAAQIIDVWSDWAEGAEWPAGIYPLENVLELPIAMIREKAGSDTDTLAWFLGNERHDVKLPGPVKQVAVAPGGKEAIVVHDKGDVGLCSLLDLGTGEVTLLYQPPKRGEPPEATAFLEGGRWAFLDARMLYIFARGKVSKPVASAVLKEGYEMNAVLGGRILLVESLAADEPFTVWSAAGSKLEKLAGFEQSFTFVIEKDGVVYLRDGYEFFELTGLEEDAG